MVCELNLFCVLWWICTFFVSTLIEAYVKTYTWPPLHLHHQVHSHQLGLRLYLSASQLSLHHHQILMLCHQQRVSFARLTQCLFAWTNTIHYFIPIISNRKAIIKFVSTTTKY
ncbi:hypothetical protein L211DRAFT_670819 [Terfezia boudieri ATCC MYA-4762]|uniref:Uncharacterized protein n=1 Tax=Terfezia boudieri ATCC MYA-4762 TaxID=1051890 RepID=A0A3N4LB71_9PEZI|nr:hypothetical protein L211DRAFT_670819 [Terfezia boudieri ATCC MYA-4762]